ncbi:unnamed protein product, partial [Laminaria digitata]
MTILRSVLSLSLLAGLTACSDGTDTSPAPPEPPPISIDTPNADRCEMLDADNCMFP